MKNKVTIKTYLDSLAVDAIGNANLYSYCDEYKNYFRYSFSVAIESDDFSHDACQAVTKKYANEFRKLCEEHKIKIDVNPHRGRMQDGVNYRWKVVGIVLK